MMQRLTLPVSRCRLLCTFLLACFALCLCQLTRAAGPPTRKLPPDLASVHISLHLKSQTLAGLIEQLSTQLQRGIVVDGLPQVQEADVDVDGTGTDTLDRVGEAFDYTWRINKSGIVLLTKRFARYDTLPQTHFLEMRQMAQDLLRIWPAAPTETRTSYYPFNQVGIYPANALFRALSPEQRKVLEMGQLLTYSQLSSEQQELTRLGVYNSLVQTSRDLWETLASRLDAMPGGYLQWQYWNPQQPEQAAQEPMRHSLDYIYHDGEGTQRFARLLPASEVKPGKLNSEAKAENKAKTKN